MGGMQQDGKRRKFERNERKGGRQANSEIREGKHGKLAEGRKA